MAIEKAFAIDATPGEIWDALWQDLAQGDKSNYALESSSRPRALNLRLKLGDVPVALSYQIEAKDGYTEVAATIEPLAARYKLYQLLTFGHLRRNYEMLLVQGLSNLKQRLEGEPGPATIGQPLGPEPD